MISIDAKGFSLDFKAYRLANNFKSLALSGRMGFQSPGGVQGQQSKILAPNETFTYTSSGNPSVLLVRTSGATANILLATLRCHQRVDTGVYSIAPGVTGDGSNYTGTEVLVAMEVNQFLLWTGSFIDIAFENPQTESVLLDILQG